MVLDLAAVKDEWFWCLLKGGWVRLLTVQDEELMEAGLLEGGTCSCSELSVRGRKKFDCS